MFRAAFATSALAVVFLAGCPAGEPSPRTSGATPPVVERIDVTDTPLTDAAAPAPDAFDAANASTDSGTPPAAITDATCATAINCKRFGACRAVDGACAASSDDDCKPTTDCAVRGACRLQNGACLATSD